MHFAEPKMMWLLLAVPLAILVFAVRAAQRRRLLAKLGSDTALASLTASVSPSRRVAKIALILGALTLVALAAARPQAGEKTVVAPRTGIDIVIALDFSKSMYARDAFPSRIDRAKAELGRFLERLGGDRVGLVAFAGDTLSYPLTTDYTAAKLFWRDLTPNDMPYGGTAIGRAIVAAIRLLKGVRGKGKERSQVILLLTDGEDQESEPKEAAKQAAKLGIRIYTVGIGSPSGEPVPEVDEEGNVTGYMQHNGKPITTRLDEPTLSEVARITSGKFIRMEAKQFAVEPILKAMGKLKQSEFDGESMRIYEEEVYHWFLFPALLLLLIELAIGGRRTDLTRKVPTTGGSS